MVERKQDVVNEIRDLQNLPRVQLGRGSSIPHEFFSDIARELALPLQGTMPLYARAIIEHAGLNWSSEYSSESTKSGGGSTVTYEGLCAIRDAYVIWSSEMDSDHEFENWSPPENWLELRNSEVQRELVSKMVRPNWEHFRNGLLAQYGGKCAITGCSRQDLLEAAHIVPYFGEESDSLQNGILLRVDFHRAFDAGLFDISFDSDRKLFISWMHAELLENYPEFHNAELRAPKDPGNYVSENALEIRRKHLNLNLG